ncbi:MAG: hypothetical protein WBO58_03495, partial [Gammaproteobacteria bacterium]
MKPVRIHYPWLSTLGALAMVCWQFLLANPGLFRTEPLPELMRQSQNLLIAGAVLVLLVVFDIWHYLKATTRSKNRLQQYQAQISELLDSRRELGT